RPALDRGTRHEEPLRAGRLGGRVTQLLSSAKAGTQYAATAVVIVPARGTTINLSIMLRTPMIPWEKIDTARIPGTDDELRLKRRGKEFSIMLGTNELMNSRLSGSEAALATLAAKKIEKVAKPHLLIGGLGMGFTLRAALAVLGSKAQIVVAELVPAVVAWARGPMAEIFGDSLNDRRVSIRESDVTEIIRSRRAKFDAILLDVD